MFKHCSLDVLVLFWSPVATECAIFASNDWKTESSEDKHEI